ncbi:disease resistance protein RGA3 [Canna indica]|uniref:Disease resistance protein RGA3 n=1 Tax=Canna indica TaxID=4628 RepID=A0AAQ3KXM2_9LILI|nr:disease resistance protein RGA3 [Canna indica]
MMLRPQQFHDEDNDDDDEPFIIVIHGEVGLGKTTLARLIFHHPWVNQHFDHRFWVDMSNFSPFEPTMSIAKEIAKSLLGKPSDHLQQTLQAMWALLYERLNQSRYLLVLDDLNMFLLEQHSWDQLKHILLSMGAPGSAVIIIPADVYYPTFASTLGSCSINYSLKGISKDAWQELFIKHESMQPKQDIITSTFPADILLQFLDRVYSEFNGFPLFAKIMGSIFRYTETSRWRELVDTFSIEKIRENPSYALILFHNIPPKYAQFFLVNYVYDPYVESRTQSRIIQDKQHMLVIEGFLPHSSDTQTKEAFVIDRFTYYYKHFNLSKHQKAFNLQYVCSIRVSQCSRIPQQCCHLCLLVDSNTCAFPTTLCSSRNKKLRTLILDWEEEEMMLPNERCQIKEIPKQLFAKLVHLRVVNLPATMIQRIPNTVGKLLQLRYLSLSQSEIETLPQSLCNLGNLQILNLAHCEKLRNLHILKLCYCTKLQVLPKSVTRLVNLQELDIECCPWLAELPEDVSNMTKLVYLKMMGCVSLTRMPRGIGQLDALYELSGYIVPDDHHESNALMELQGLTNIEQLGLRNLERVTNPEVAQIVQLHEKKMLRHLALHWEYWQNLDDKSIDYETQLQLFQGLQPASGLQKLDIISYMGKRLPSWMTEGFSDFRTLSEVRLINLRQCDSLPPLGQLQFLKLLEISGMDSLSVVGDAFYGETGTFRYLEVLIFSQMLELEKWEKVEREDEMFRLLRNLTLIECPKLKELEVCLRHLRCLAIWFNNRMLWTSSFLEWHNLKSVDSVEIVGCEELTNLPSGIKHFKKLNQLKIIGCSKLVFLPDWLEKFRYLESLYIFDCAADLIIPEHLRIYLESDIRTLKFISH